MLVDAVLLAALAVEAEEPADRHPRLVILVKEPARLPLHAKAPQPVPAHRLPEAPTTSGICASAAAARQEVRRRGGVEADEVAGGGDWRGGGRRIVVE